MRVPLGFVGRRRFWNGLERGILSAGLTVIALVADWLLARRLAHDRNQAVASGGGAPPPGGPPPG
jgi:hypothetical protein